MSSGVTSPRLAEVLSRENFVLRDDLQQDKRATLLAVARMFDDYKVPYVVSGGLAVQLYNVETRPTVDVDIVSLRKAFEELKADQPWPRYGFELVFDHRRHIKLRHAASNVEVDINVDARFSRLVENYETESVDGLPVRFTAPEMLALTKLRTQRSDWPRDPIKRVQDRGDLMALLKTRPEIVAKLRSDPLTTDEMRTILDDILHELARPASDELPPEEEQPTDRTD
jgi:hypothetical protein